MIKTIAAILVAAGLLSACASVPPNPVTPTLRQSLYVKDVTTAWTPEPKFEAQLAKRAKLDAEKQAQFEAERADLEARLPAALRTAFATSPAGSDAVTFDVRIKRFYGGISGHVLADVAVIRVSDGAEIGVYKDIMGIDPSGSGGGLLGYAIAAMMKPDSVGIMSNAFAANMRGRFDSAK